MFEKENINQKLPSAIEIGKYIPKLTYEKDKEAIKTFYLQQLGNNNRELIDFNSKYEVEHIFPQKHLEEWKTSEYIEKLPDLMLEVHNFDNLTLLYKESNLYVSNSSYQTKREYISKFCKLSINNIFKEHSLYTEEMQKEKRAYVLEGFISLYKELFFNEPNKNETKLAKKIYWNK